MTDAYARTSPTTQPRATPTHDEDQGTAARMAGAAAEAGEHLLEDARAEAKAVTGEARRQLGDLWSQTRGELSDQVGAQQVRAAGGLNAAGDQLLRMADADEEQNALTDLVRELGGGAGRLGRWLEEHGPEDALREVQGFARRRPAMFLAVAAGTGIVAGRLTRGMRDAPARPAVPRAATSRTPVPTGTAPGAVRTPGVQP
ncbi:hypothetical protein [Cellulomonas soli]